MSISRKFNRRELFRHLGAALALPHVMPRIAVGKDDRPIASNRITLGCVGLGGRGKENMRNFIGHSDCQVVAVCDVNSIRLEEAKSIVDSHYGNSSCAAYHDYRELFAREDIDAVMIATPDQWHVIQSIEAARSGKDIYLEKPLGLSVTEDIALRRVIKRYNRVFQFGTQQRSDRNFRFACELVLNGRIGKIENIIASAPASRAVGNYPPIPVPPTLDYEMWVGPAQWMPYTHGIVDNCGQWGHISNFSLGWITTWGVHHVDIMQWGNNADRSGPVEIEAKGLFPEDGLYNCAVAWDVKLKYSNGVVVDFVDNKKYRQGVHFQGAEGWVFVKRGHIDSHPKSLLNERIRPEENKLTSSNDHWRNFLDCVRDRNTPVSSIDSAVRSDTVCHLSDIAMRLGRKLKWDPIREIFPEDEEANRMLSRSMRAPWHL